MKFRKKIPSSISVLSVETRSGIGYGVDHHTQYYELVSHSCKENVYSTFEKKLSIDYLLLSEQTNKKKLL